MKDIVGLEGQYSVTTDGRVWSHKRRRFMSRYMDIKGYAKVSLRDSRNGQRRYRTPFIHRMVAEAFLPNPSDKPEVDHINNCRDDNRVENLQWVTRVENNQKAWSSGDKVYCYTDRVRARRRISDDDASEMCEAYATGLFSQKEIAAQLGVSQAVISRIVRGETYVCS